MGEGVLRLDNEIPCMLSETFPEVHSGQLLIFDTDSRSIGWAGFTFLASAAINSLDHGVVVSEFEFQQWGG
jgi:hypothetical protein